MSGRGPHFEWRDAFARAGYRGAVDKVGAWIGARWNGDNKHPLAPVSLLARETGYSERSVKLALKRLRDDGWIAQINRGGRKGDGTAWSSRYRLTVPNLNVQSSAPQGATGCTPVDQTFRPDNPTLIQPGTAPMSYSEADLERGFRKWVDCPSYPWDAPSGQRPRLCSQCEINEGCAVRLQRRAEEWSN